MLVTHQVIVKEQLAPVFLISIIIITTLKNKAVKNALDSNSCVLIILHMTVHIKKARPKRDFRIDRRTYEDLQIFFSFFLGIY